MNAKERIVVGIDGSEFSPAPLRLAGRYAAALGAPLDAITCVGFSDFYLAAHLPPGNPEMTTRLEEVAAGLVEQDLETAFGEDRPPRLSTTVKFGRRPRSLSKRARMRSCLSWAAGATAVSSIRSWAQSAAPAPRMRFCPVLVVGQESGDK